MDDATPYLALWIAVIEATISDLRCGKPSPERNDAVAWVQNGSKEIGSFEWVCDTISAGTRVKSELRKLANDNT